MSKIKASIEKLLTIVAELQEEYKHTDKQFTLDGRLVGDIGEALCSEFYDIQLLPGLEKHYDAKTSDGLKVQIKTTMKDSLTFPADNVPDHYLGVKVHNDGELEEIFNGPGKLIKEQALNNRTTIPKNHLYSISIKKLKAINETVPDSKRINKGKDSK